MQCLAKDPSARPQRPRDLAEALQSYRARMRTADVVASKPRPAGPGTRLVLQQQSTVLAPSTESLSASGSRGGGKVWLGAGAAIVAALMVFALRREPTHAHPPAHAMASAPSPSMEAHAVAPASAPAPAPSSGAPRSACDQYCDLVTKNCAGANAEYLSRDICMKMCPAFEIGVTTADTGSGTLGCRMFHAAAAESAPAEHCRQLARSAGGAAARIRACRSARLP
jgi:hypothetical protein